MAANKTVDSRLLFFQPGTLIMEKKSFTDKEIIEALRYGGRERERAWEYFFKSLRDIAVGVIVKKGGTKAEALESCGAVAMPFEKTVRNPKFVLKYTLHTYFISCVINHCWKSRRKISGEMEFLEYEGEHIREVVETVEEQMIRAELVQLIDQTLSEIGERCKKILVMFMTGYNMKEIAEEMNFANAQVSKNEKLKCLTKYEKFLQDKPQILQQIIKLRDE